MWQLILCKYELHLISFDCSSQVPAIFTLDILIFATNIGRIMPVFTYMYILKEISYFENKYEHCKKLKCLNFIHVFCDHPIIYSFTKYNNIKKQYA